MSVNFLLSSRYIQTQSIIYFRRQTVSHLYWWLLIIPTQLMRVNK